MSKADVQQALGGIFREVFGRDDLVLQPETTARDVEGWDSFKQIEIAVAVEEHFGVRVRTRDLDRLKNVGELVDLIATKLEAA